MTAPRMTDEAKWHLPDMEVALAGKPQAYHRGRQVVLSGPDDVVAVVEHDQDAPWLAGVINREPKLMAALAASRAAESAALARVRRLEEALAFALRESGCDGDLCCHEWHARARAALSEDP